MKSLVLKGLTLCLFVSLIGLFVMYRSGYFDHDGIRSAPVSYDPNGTVINTSDTSSHNPTINFEHMSSSKSMILIDPDTSGRSSVQYTLDSTMFEKDQKAKKDSTQSKPVKDSAHPIYFHGTKSGGIYRGK